jgi:hypothetical protein
VTPPALAAAAAERLPDGARRLVLVVGAGLNAAAAGPGSAHSWIALLRGVEEDLSADGVDVPRPLPTSATAHWEALLQAMTASLPELSPADAERRLRNAVAARLRPFEDEAPQRPLFAEVLTWGLRDVVSLNFDLSLVRAAGEQRLSHAISREDLPALRRKLGRHLPHDASLYRRAELPGAVATTRVWYPHGDTGRAETIKLGVHAYGRTIRGLEHAAGAYHREEKQHEDRGGGAWRDALRELPLGSLSWATVLLGSPILFLGVGLSLEEWPLWWLLHRRSRLHARLPPTERPGTWTVLARGGPGEPPIPPHLLGRPAGLEVVDVADHPAVWTLVRGLFGGGDAP